MKTSLTRKEFKNDLEKWLNDNTILNFKGKVIDYQIILSATIPEISESEKRRLDYKAYKLHFTDYLMQLHKQFSFNIYVRDNSIDIWITSLADKIKVSQLNKCKEVIQKFFLRSK